jgi:uncharacterized protein YozE (UPF0346 family)
MAAMKSFYDWLAKQKRLRTPVGDLARSAARDKDFPRDIASLDALLEYVKTSSKGNPQAVTVARSAYQTWERELRPTR